MVIDYPWYFVLLCILLGAAYATVLYFLGRNKLSHTLRWTLSVIRFLAVSVIAFLLLAPLSKQNVTERRLPRVVLAQDISQSVAIGADSTFSYTTMVNVLNKRCNVTIDSFGTTSSTDIGVLLNRYRTDDIAALVLASDGIHNRGANPTTIAEQLSFPVYCIALGDTTPQRDAWLSNLRYNRIAMMGNEFPVEFTISAHLLGGNSTTLLVENGTGHGVLKKRVDYTDDNFAQTINLSLPTSTDKPGLQHFTIHLVPNEGERSFINNTLSFYVDIIDTRQHIAIFADAPHPDLAALKQSLERNQNYQVEIVLADNVERGKWKTTNDINLAILHNLPSQRHPSIAYADNLPKVFIIGRQTDLARFNALHSGLEIIAKSNRTNEITAIHYPAFSLFSLDEDDASAIENLPPLDAPFGEARTSSDVQTLFGARLGNIDTRQPLIAATAQGEQRHAFLWGEGIWRWRLADYQTHQSHQHVDRLIAQLVSFTAMQSNRDRLQVNAERSYAAGEPIVIQAQLYNEAYQLTNQPDVKLSLSSDSLKADYLFHRAGNTYTLSLPDLSEGVYRYRATSDNGLTTEGIFVIESLNLEQQCLVANHSLLNTIATLTGGEMYYPDQLSDLTDRLSSLKPTLYSHTRYAEILRMPLALIFILLLLATEWFLRKYFGS